MSATTTDSEALAANKQSRNYVLSWNMQGQADQDSLTKWSSLASVLSKTKGIVACCLQEAGSDVPGTYETSFGGFQGFASTDQVRLYSRKLDTSRQMAIFHYPWAKSDKGNLRCSLAVAAIGDFSKGVPTPVLVPTQGKAVRPLLGINWGGAWLFSIHANSSNLAASSAKSLVGALIGNYSLWIVAGDYNCQVTDVTGPWYVRKPAANAARLDQNFQLLPSQDIDFAVQTERTNNAHVLSHRQGIAVGVGILKSDHPATAFQILSTKGQQ